MKDPNITVTLRTYKFRAYNQLKKQMIFKDKPIGFDNFAFKEGMRVSVVNEVLKYDGNLVRMQFTGVRDKNGKDIYEGDRVSTKHGVGLVKYHVCGYTVTDPRYPLTSVNGLYNYTDCGLGDAIFCEVIGNIYENPDML